ncbi:helix-turn-helix domain-containing protein [Larkinella terrae]|uniref:Helix-turn-helix domain-containing protein n=1 Tax=Larkinella terrae TaxID=2025311 RepID=A0A7K0EK35_9BACT|nr:helix-turn-helix domain-containing protein [Larkinella terrae]
MYLPRNLKLLRNRANLSVDSVATQTDVTPENLTKFEEGNKTPSVAEANRLAALYNVSLEALLFRFMLC